MAIQLQHSDDKGARFGPFWLRRRVVLLDIGLIHAYLFWTGDILIMYSILGSALLLWRKVKPGTLLIFTLHGLVLLYDSIGFNEVVIGHVWRKLF